MVGRLARRPTYAEFTSRILEGWEACWGLVEQRMGILFLRIGEPSPIAPMGTVKLDDCNLPDQNSERDHLRQLQKPGSVSGRL